MFWRRVLAPESSGDEKARHAGHQEHFRLLGEEGRSWSGNEPDVFFDNRGGTFVESAGVVGLASTLDGRGAAAADLDDDGDLDLVVVSRNSPTVRILRNEVPTHGGSVLVDLEPMVGEGTLLGAEVEARCGGRVMHRLLTAGSGFLSQAPARLHFGLGDCAEASLHVRRGATVRDVGVVRPGTRVTVRGHAITSVAPLKERVVAPPELPHTGAGAFRSSTAPPAVVEVLDDGGAPTLEKGTTVVNFWATWCVSCRDEHEALLAVAADPRFDDVAFWALSLDHEPDTPDAAARAAWGTRFRQGRVGPEAFRPFAGVAELAADAVPLTVVVRDGVVRWTHPGAVREDSLRGALETALAPLRRE